MRERQAIREALDRDDYRDWQVRQMDERLDTYLEHDAAYRTGTLPHQWPDRYIPFQGVTFAS